MQAMSPKRATRRCPACGAEIPAQRRAHGGLTVLILVGTGLSLAAFVLPWIRYYSLGFSGLDLVTNRFGIIQDSWLYGLALLPILVGLLGAGLAWWLTTWNRWLAAGLVAAVAVGLLPLVVVLATVLRGEGGASLQAGLALAPCGLLALLVVAVRLWTEPAPARAATSCPQCGAALTPSPTPADVSPVR